jgi:hypothetical protein
VLLVNTLTSEIIQDDNKTVARQIRPSDNFVIVVLCHLFHPRKLVEGHAAPAATRAASFSPPPTIIGNGRIESKSH